MSSSPSFEILKVPDWPGGALTTAQASEDGCGLATTRHVQPRLPWPPPMPMWPTVSMAGPSLVGRGNSLSGYLMLPAPPGVAGDLSGPDEPIVTRRRWVRRAATLAVLAAGVAAGCGTARLNPDEAGLKPDPVEETGLGTESSTARPAPATDSGAEAGPSPAPSAEQPLLEPAASGNSTAGPGSDPGRGFGAVWKTSDGLLLGQWNHVPVWYVDSWSSSQNYPAIRVIDDSRLVVIRTQPRVLAYFFDSATGTAALAAPSGFEGRINRDTVVWAGQQALIGITKIENVWPLLWLTYNPVDDAWGELTVDPLPDDLAIDRSEAWWSEWIESHGATGSGVWDGSEVLFPHESLSGLALDPDQGSWRVLAAGPLSPRQGPNRVWTGRELVVWGGCDAALRLCGNRERLRDGAIYEPSSDTWRDMALSTLPPLYGEVTIASVWAGTEVLYIVADTNGTSAASYNPALDQWTTLPAPPFDPGYYSLGLAWSSISDLVLAWGGKYVSNGAAYDLSAKKWLRLPDAPRNSVVRKNAKTRMAYSIAAIGNTFYIDGGYLEAGEAVFGALTLTPHPRVYIPATKS